MALDLDTPAGAPSPNGAPRRVSAMVDDLIDDGRVRAAASGVAGVLAFAAVLRYLWDPPLGVVVQGIVIGGLTALISFGMVLVYRTNRIINFAQGDLGGIPASLAVLLIVSRFHWPYPLAMLTGIVAAVVLGALVELLIVRRFFRAPRLILTVATIGIAQLMAGLSVVMPRAFGVRTPPQSYPSPFDFKLTIDPIIFHGNDVIAMLVIPIAIAALAAFFRYTDIGIAVRASAENADRAALLGVPVKRIHTIVWVVATLLATVAMMLRAGIVGLPIGSVLGPGILLRALAAAVIGRMERLPTVFFAAVALGIVEQAVVWDTGKGSLVDPIIFVVILAALLLQRRGRTTRVEEQATSSWQAAREVRPVPRELAHLPEVRYGLKALGLLLLAFLLWLPAPLDDGRTNLAAAVLIFGIIGISLVVLTGWAGQISLGQIAFFGVGAAVAGYLTTAHGWDLSLALPAAGVAGAAVALVIGLPALRIRGLFLAVVTLAFALATSSYFLRSDYIHWLPTGRILRPALFGRVDLEDENRYYYLCLAAFLLCLAAARGLRNSRTGRVLIGMRENERGAQAYGVNVMRARLTAFAVSGFFAAFAGGLFVHHQHGLGVASFRPEESLRAFTMVVIGGLGSVPGALLGATYLKSTEWFRNLLPDALRPAFGFFGTGVGLLFVLMVIPAGLGSVLYGARDRLLRLVAARRGIAVPSLVADARIEAPALDTGELVLTTPAEDGDGAPPANGRRRPKARVPS